MTRCFGSIFIFILVSFSVLFGSSPKAQAAGEFKQRDVVFYEIMWAGSNNNTSDEWFVLKNNTDSSIVLGGWKVTSSKLDDDSELPVVTLTGEVPADGYFLVSRKAQEESIIGLDADMIESFSLNNSNLKLKLYDSASNLIDTAGDGSKPPAGSNIKPKSSMVRTDTSIAGDNNDAWVSSTAQCNLDAGATELATPQSSDEDTKCHPPSIELLNKWPSTLKLGETFTARLIASDEGDATVSGSINNTNKQWTVGETISRDIKCDATGELKVTITVTDGKLSASRLDKTLQCYDSGAVVINEVLPAPKSTDYDQSGVVDTKDEWIELHNTETRAVDLTGWSLGDKANPKKYVIDAPAIIEPDGFLTITHRQSGIALNDDGDEVYLFDPSGQLVDKIIYSKSHDSAGWARFDTSFEWTLSPTFNATNIRSPISIEKDAVAAYNIDNAPDPPQIEIVTYKITKTRTIQPPDLELLTEVPDLSEFGRKVSEIARAQTNASRLILLEQLIIGLGGLLSLARIGYNLVYLLL